MSTLLTHHQHAQSLTSYQKMGLTDKNYCYMTLHRPSNVDNKNQLRAFIETILLLSKKIAIVWPLHPRVKKTLGNYNLLSPLENEAQVILCSPLNYLDNINIMSHSKFVITDSGGLQEETTVLHVPCLTFRDNTERPITITQGSNQLVGTNPQYLLKKAETLLTQKKKTYPIPKYWDGQTAKRILDHMQNYLENKK